MLLKISSPLLIIFLMFYLSACGQNNADSLTKEGVVKIVTTKAYTAKQEFDKLVIDSAVFELGYDESMGVDFSWKTMHLDKYDNVLYHDNFFPDGVGGAEVYSKTTRKYYSPEEKLLSNVRIESYPNSITEKEYIRNDKGKLQEIRETMDGKLFKKTIFTYNNSGQRVQIEVFKEGGLIDLTKYEYSPNSLPDDEPIKEFIEVYGDYNYKEENEYEWSKENLLVKSRKKLFEKGKLSKDFTILSSNFINNIPTKEVSEGYSGPTYLSDGTVFTKGQSYRTITTREVNQQGNIIKHKRESEFLSKPKDDLLNRMNRPDLYQLEYTYNNLNEWTQIILTVEKYNSKFIITREVKYL